MEIRKGVFDVAKWPMTTAVNLGGFVLDITGLNDRVLRLYEEEPMSRALTALRGATHAIRKSKPDQALAQFEVLRAAGAVKDISKLNPDAAGEIGKEVIEIALELPDEEKSFEIVEEVTKTSLETFAPPRITRHYPLSD